MRTQIILTCPVCNKEYSKDKSEYTRNLKIGRTSYCSLNCSGYINQIGHDNRSNYDISKHCANQHDEYTDFRYYLKLISLHKKNIDITLENLKNLWKSQGGICPYTKVNLKLQTHSSLALHKVSDWYLYASVDRIDSSKPYSLDNIEFISVGINYLKNRFKKQEVINFLKIISNNLQDE